MYFSRTGFSLSTVTSGVVRGAQISPGSWNVNAARRAAASPLGETHRRRLWRAGLCIIFHCGLGVGVRMGMMVTTSHVVFLKYG